MALTYPQKEHLVSLVRERVEASNSLIITHYSGMKVSEISSLRSQGKAQDVVFQVARNTLARLALKGTEYEALVEHLNGPVMMAYSFEDPGAAARLLKEAKKTVEALKIVAFGVGGIVFDGKELDRLATLPTRDEALAIIARLLKTPITTLAQDLSDVPGRLARVLYAVKEQKS